MRYQTSAFSLLPSALFLFVQVLFFLTWTITGMAQEVEKLEAAVVPLVTIGEISETQKQIMFNSLLDKLSETYSLIPQERFRQAQDQAFAELEEQQCTEAQCIRKIQELLQVENLFVLQVVRDGLDTQLTCCSGRGSIDSHQAFLFPLLCV